MHTKSQRGYKMVYYCTHRVTGRKITGQKLRVLSARLSLLAPALRQDVFDRGTHRSHTTLSKHINTVLLTDKKTQHLPTVKFLRNSRRKTAFFFFFFFRWMARCLLNPLRGFGLLSGTLGDKDRIYKILKMTSLEL